MKLEAMHRRNFLKKATLTVAFLSGLRSDARPVVSKQSETEEMPEWYFSLAQESQVEKKAYYLGAKIFRPGMELAEFTKLFIRELQRVYPLGSLKTSSVVTLSTLAGISEGNEIRILILSRLVDLWLNRILFFGTETVPWHKPSAETFANFQSESNELYDSVVKIGLALPLQGHSFFMLNSKNDFAIPLTSVSFQVMKFAKKSEETIRFFPIGLDLKTFSKDAVEKPGGEVQFRFLIDDLCDRLNSLQLKLRYSAALWGQYTIRFHYLTIANSNYLNIIDSTKSIGGILRKKRQNLLRLSVMEAAVEKILRSARNFKSGVYTTSERQLVQIELSSLVHVTNDISQNTVGIAKSWIDYRIENKDGHILSISTQGGASEAMVVFEEALQKLRKERAKILTGLSP